MKKSKKIRLVLVTALLASCNRIIIPADPAARYATDPALLATPAAGDSSYACSCELPMPDPVNPGPYITYYAGGYISSYFPGPIYRKGSFRGGHPFIFRGGFGKSGMIAGS